jgi:hypothetical protein
MNGKIERWSIGGGERIFYTEDLATHRELSRLYPAFATYERGGRTFAWHHRIPTSAPANSGLGIDAKPPLQNKDLQATEPEISTEQLDLFGNGRQGSPEGVVTLKEAG